MNLSIDVDTLTVGDIEQLEECTRVKQMIDWLVKHAGANADELRALPAREIKSVLADVRDKLKDAFDLPKANGAHS